MSCWVKLKQIALKYLTFKMNLLQGTVDGCSPEKDRNVSRLVPCTVWFSVDSVDYSTEET